MISDNLAYSATCQAAKSGTWYPADSQSLATELDHYMNQAQCNTHSKPRIIIVPHPGLAFGGPTAAYAYKSAQPYAYRNIIIIATSHLSRFKGAIVGDFNEYETPFGPIQGNRDISSFLTFKSNLFSTQPQLIQEEHSLEMQYPFIKKYFSTSQIVPIVLSADSTPDQLFSVAQLIYETLTADDLIILSTDLSHYPNYEQANIVDPKTLSAIITLDPNQLMQTLDTQQKNLPPNTSTLACGAASVLTGMYVSNLLGLQSAHLLHYENSGDRPIGKKDSVVGYGAITIESSPQEKFSETITLTPAEKDELLKIAKHSIQKHLSEIDPLTISIPPDSVLNQPFGVFVTLYKDGQLRGCMGMFEPKEPLKKVVEIVAEMSAFQDPRFAQVALKELDQIQFFLSILSPRKAIQSYHEIIPGKHGVYVQKHGSAGTYLPQVATEQGWDRATFLNSLCQSKSGINRDAWKDGSAQLFTYTAFVFKESD